MRLLSIIILLAIALSADAQYAPQAGVAGTTAIRHDDKRFVAWAETCTVELGWLDIADKSQGKPTTGTSSDALGPRDAGIVSLGDSGVAIVTFPAALYNGPGPDFAVFENGFADPTDPEMAFLELAFVEVSSDGISYTRFPASCVIDTPQVPGAGVYSNARKINNLAGKYISGYGTPFDLEELKGTSGLDVNNITHVLIVDAIGSIGANASVDKDGNKINDPYPTPYPTSGFDLDAVGAINIPGWWPADVLQNEYTNTLMLSPNPATDVLHLSGVHMVDAEMYIMDVSGRIVRSATLDGNTANIDISNFAKGVYFIKLNAGGKKWIERFIKY